MDMFCSTKKKEYFESEEFLSLSKDKQIEILRDELNKVLNMTRYGLVWEEHPEQIDLKDLHLTVLKDKALSLPMIPNKPMNYLIEGDNYHALQVLQKTHKGKVDVIYIDPPYNTGKEFVYNDKLVDKEDMFSHSKWLSFMSKRLKLARELLSDDGVIFVSIDDNEQAQLKLLMDKIFGEVNHQGTMVQLKGNTQNNANNIQKNHEYIHVYSKKSIVKGRLSHVQTKKERVQKIDENSLADPSICYYRDKTRLEKGGYTGGKLKDRVHLGYSIYVNRQTKDFVPVIDYDVNNVKLGMDYVELYKDNKDLITKGYDLIIRPSEVNNEIGRWRWSIDTFLERKAEIRIDLKSERAFIIEAVSSEDIIQIKNKVFISRKVNNPLKSILNFPTKVGSDTYNSMGIKTNFSYPKNMNMIKHLIESYSSDTAVVLDFFAGSGTTGHAVMELNKEDGGNRQFILCTNNEVSEEKEREYLATNGYIEKPQKQLYNKFKKEQPEQYETFLNSEDYQALGIARSVTRERLKRVIEGYTTPKGEEIEGLPNNLVYLQTSTFTDEELIDEPEYNIERLQMIHELKYPATHYETIYVSPYKNKESITNIQPKTNLPLLLVMDTEDNYLVNRVTEIAKEKFPQFQQVIRITDYL